MASKRSAVLAVLVCCLLPAAAPAADKPERLPARVETRHTIVLGGHPLDYRAIAETIGLTDRTGNPAASIFTISYLADAPAGASRPVAFVFNGGPGAASVFLHLGALGPRVLDTPANGAVPPPPVHLIDNPATWLAFSDLVFVDPVGTGFSHAEGKQDDPDKHYWNVNADLDSLGAVIRRWLSRHQRWQAPVYLVGESYGGLRAAALGERLADRVGVTVSGLVLISPALDIEILHPDITDSLAAAFELPSYAAVAATFSGKSATAAAESAEHFALSDYLVGLAGMRGEPAAGDPLIAHLAQLTGLPEEVVRRERGRVPNRVFASELRRGERQLLSLYDGTVTRAAAANPHGDRGGDPVLDPATAAYTAAFDTYAPEALGYHTEEPYRTLSRQTSEEWNWDAARDGARGLGLALASLETVLRAHPETRVLIANGRYDLVTPYLASRWLIDQLVLPAPTRAHIRLRVYDGGHMMYMRPQSRAALASDAAALFAGTASPSH